LIIVINEIGAMSVRILIIKSECATQESHCRAAAVVLSTHTTKREQLLSYF